ncbi:class I SAM-dependent methyltransferase [Candidatus Bipolaricaulota bacterium]
MAFSTDETCRDGTYTHGRSEAETKRLILQSQLYEGVTRRLFEEAGIVEGMRILDVGSGSGDVALVAAGLVGSRGEVVGVDVNGAILETACKRATEAGFRNITFIEGDARSVEFSGTFDAIVGRLVLMYVSNPTSALRQLAKLVRSGGIVAFQELDYTTYPSLKRPDSPVANNLIDWLIAVSECAGVHIGMGIDLYRTFVDAGLPEPVLGWTAPIGCRGTWPGYQYVADSFRSLLPLIEQYGIATSEEVDVRTLAERLHSEAVAIKRPIILAPHVTAWARLPAK